MENAAEPVPTRLNLAGYVLAGCAPMGDKPALEIWHPGEEAPAEIWSHAQLMRAVLGVATGLRATGLAPGARVLLRLGNDIDFPLAFLGAIAADLVPVVTSAALTEGEVTEMARLVAPRLVIASPGIALPDLSGTETISSKTMHGFAAAPPWQIEPGDPEREAYLVFTSGTSARPRAVRHAHRAIWARRMMRAGWYGLRQSDRLLHAGAFNWTYTLGTGLMDPWSMGATALVPGPGTRPGDLPEIVAHARATILAAAPGVFRQALRAPFGALPDLRHGLSAGEKLPEPTRAAWKAATGTEIHEAFGMSECSTFISGAPARPAPPDTLGFAQPGRKIAILGAQGAPLGPGEPGGLAISRTDPGLMLGYLDDPQAMAERVRGPWFLTGDEAVMTPDGAITYRGRADDIINAGGYRISPEEVEAALCLHPGVHEAAAVELQVSEEASIVACAYVPETDLVEEEVLATHVQALLAPYKRPRLYRAMSALPRRGNGKLNRRLLRVQWQEETP